MRTSCHRRQFGIRLLLEKSVPNKFDPKNPA